MAANEIHCFQCLDKIEWNNTIVIKEDVVGEITKLKQDSGSDIMPDGSTTPVQSLLLTGLIDEFQFIIHPETAGISKRFLR